MMNGKSGGDDGISTEMLKYPPPSGIREMAKMIRSIWVNKKVPDLWKHAIRISLDKELPFTDPRNYRGMFLQGFRTVYAGPTYYTSRRNKSRRVSWLSLWPMTDMVFIVKRMIEITLSFSTLLAMIKDQEGLFAYFIT
ncbi:hypothetical protein RB195_022587 [Necator americanus]|uniref:Uncharacterized protein n=1 Tax=Necator americanus TaxID=51031 RepID=A0ABR1EFW0_NECAM